MELIQTVTLGSAASSISFSTLPTSYDDILIVVSGRTDRASVTDDVKVEFNGVNTNQSVRLLFGTGSSASSATDTLIYGWTNGGNSTSNTFGSTQFYIPNYRSAAAKSVSIDAINEGNQTTQYQGLAAAQWNSTAAITDITLRPYTGPNFVTGTSASLYGIKSARSFAKATGGTIFYDAVNNKVVHVFTASGTFTPTANITCEYLVIAGGGSGGTEGGGGGGAGGYRSSVVGQGSGGGASAESTLSLVSGTGYTVTVGAGGASAANGSQGNNGSNSVFSTITSVGGGGGGIYGGISSPLGNGKSGGSGGGGGIAEAGNTANGGAGTANQGFAGGNGQTASPFYGGGGGGSGSVGANASGGAGGNGGSGVSSNITGAALTRAGGGGGTLSGTGSAGGGNGAASNGATGFAASANSGSGGGGGRNAASGAGGSGIVIVRYDA
jgi:hypothetical protein